MPCLVSAWLLSPHFPIPFPFSSLRFQCLLLMLVSELSFLFHRDAYLAWLLLSISECFAELALWPERLSKAELKQVQ